MKDQMLLLGKLYIFIVSVERSKLEHFVLLCEKHPFSHRIDCHMKGGKCRCSENLPENICSFCGDICYVLNFRGYKLCMREIPKSMKSKVVPRDECFKNIKFVYDKKSKKVEALLDKLSEHRIPKKSGEYE